MGVKLTPTLTSRGIKVNNKSIITELKFWIDFSDLLLASNKCSKALSKTKLIKLI